MDSMIIPYLPICPTPQAICIQQATQTVAVPRFLFIKIAPAPQDQQKYVVVLWISVSRLGPSFVNIRPSAWPNPIACVQPLWLAWAVNYLYAHYSIFCCLHSLKNFLSCSGWQFIYLHINLPIPHCLHINLPIPHCLHPRWPILNHLHIHCPISPCLNILMVTCQNVWHIGMAILHQPCHCYPLGKDNVENPLLWQYHTYTESSQFWPPYPIRPGETWMERKAKPWDKVETSKAFW